MLISRIPGEYIVILNTDEAASLVDACAVLLLACESLPEVSLQHDTANLLQRLFDGMKAKS